MVSLFSLKIIDKYLHSMHTNRSGLNRLLTIGGSLVIYAAVLVFLGDYLEVSANYFIILPLIAAAFSFGLPGGIIAGALGLPLNLLIFKFTGHPEYSPSSSMIAEITGILIGAVLGYLSDYYFRLEVEIQKRREVENKLQQSVAEKEILIQEIHHRVKNNLNLVKSLIQLQINRSKNKVFREESERLINRIFSIARVHDKLYRWNTDIEPSLSEYLPELVNDIVTGLNSESVKISYAIDIPETRLSIEQATSLGLILNEVLTNTIKYSFPLVKDPELIVKVSGDAEAITIELKNNAPTFIPEENENDGLGLKIVKTLCSQIDAQYSWVPGNGTTFRLVMPV